jgi:hypothetical protein
MRCYRRMAAWWLPECDCGFYGYFYRVRVPLRVGTLRRSRLRVWLGIVGKLAPLCGLAYLANTDSNSAGIIFLLLYTATALLGMPAPNSL